MATTTDPIGDTPAASPTTEGDLPLDVIFDLLSIERRRRVLRYLLDRSGPETVTLSDLAEHIAGIENDKPEQLLSSSERKRVYISLYQCHLPKLDDADVVDFDGDRKTVEIGENAEALTPYLAEHLEQEPTGGERDSVDLVAAIAGLLPGGV